MIWDAVQRQSIFRPAQKRGGAAALNLAVNNM